GCRAPRSPLAALDARHRADTRADLGSARCFGRTQRFMTAAAPGSRLPTTPLDARQDTGRIRLVSPSDTHMTLDFDALISDRARSVDVSGIRRVFELGAKLKNPINLSIGQPDFPVPDRIKQATIRAIENDRNGYTLTQGVPELQNAIANHLAADVGWKLPSDDLAAIVTSGTSGALWLAFMA